MRSKIIAAAVRFAEERHGSQLYGNGEPYMVHLAQTVAWLDRMDPNAPDSVVCAAWLHDVLEDTPTSRSEVEARFGTDTAEIVAACSGTGGTRSERLASILRKIAALPPTLRAQAALVKVADRCANVDAALASESSKYTRMYQKEHPRFLALREVTPPAAEDGWAFLGRALAP